MIKSEGSSVLDKHEKDKINTFKWKHAVFKHDMWMCILVCASLCVWYNTKAHGRLFWEVRNLPGDGEKG